MEDSRLDTELSGKMADLDLMEMDGQIKSDTLEFTARVLRKRKSAPEVTKSNNRRVSMKPCQFKSRKHTVAENANPKEIEALYLNKRVKTLSQTLETIYEEPKTDSNNEAVISGRKVKRLLIFQPGSQYTKDKIKKRRAKIKKMLSNNSFLNRKKIPMNVFLESIECLELDEVIKTEVTNITIPNQSV